MALVFFVQYSVEFCFITEYSCVAVYNNSYFVAKPALKSITRNWSSAVSNSSTVILGD